MKKSKNNIQWSLWIQGNDKDNYTIIDSKTKEGLYTYAKCKLIDGNNKLTIVFDKALKDKKVQVEPFRNKPDINNKKDYVRTTTINEISKPKIIEIQTAKLWLEAQCDDCDDNEQNKEFLKDELFKLEGCGDCGTEFEKQFKCVKYHTNYGPAHLGNVKLEDYEYWQDLIIGGKITQEEKEILVAMSANEGNLDAVQSYDSEVFSVGAMQKTVNIEGKGEFPIQVQEFKNDYPQKYICLFENCGWTVENNTIYYKDPSNSSAKKITGSLLKNKIREGFTKSTCKPLAPIVKAAMDKDFQSKQIEDFIARLRNEVLPIKPSGYNYTLGDYLKSKLGKATALDYHVNRPGYVRTDFGKALDNFFSSKDNEEISKDPSKWGDLHAKYEREILDDYGINRRGTDMQNRYERIKNRLGI